MHKIAGQTLDSRMIWVFVVICALTLAAGMLFAKASTPVIFAFAIGLIVAIISFVSTEMALYILIVAMLLFRRLKLQQLIAPFLHSGYVV